MFALTLMIDAVSQYKTVFATATDTALMYGTESVQYLKTGLGSRGLEGFCAVVAAVFFVLFGYGHLKGKSNASESKLMALFPVLSFEARSIVRGTRLRGVFPRAIDVALHPALAYECCYTPLVMRCLRLSAELAASAELRGIEADGVRTSVHHVGFEAREALAAVAVLAVCAGLCVWGKVA